MSRLRDDPNINAHDWCTSVILDLAFLGTLIIKGRILTPNGEAVDEPLNLDVIFKTMRVDRWLTNSEMFDENVDPQKFIDQFIEYYINILRRFDINFSKVFDSRSVRDLRKRWP